MGEHTKEQFCWLLFIFTGLHWTLVVAHRSFDLSCGLWNPVPQPGMIGPPALGMHPWITREVSTQCIQDRSKAQSKEGNMDVLTSEERSRGSLDHLHWGHVVSLANHLISCPFLT